MVWLCYCDCQCRSLETSISAKVPQCPLWETSQPHLHVLYCDKRVYFYFLSSAKLHDLTAQNCTMRPARSATITRRLPLRFHFPPSHFFSFFFFFFLFTLFVPCSKCVYLPYCQWLQFSTLPHWACVKDLKHNWGWDSLCLVEDI